MQLPAWVYSGSDVLYVYDDGGLMMEVYEVENGESSYEGTKVCKHDLSKMRRLESPWREVMERRRRIRLQGTRDSGQPALF